jgi:hypothetical protein
MADTCSEPFGMVQDRFYEGFRLAIELLNLGTDPSPSAQDARPVESY